jgi:hypothetical protein
MAAPPAPAAAAPAPAVSASPAAAIGRVALKRVAVAMPARQPAVEVQAAVPAVRTVPMPAAPPAARFPAPVPVRAPARSGVMRQPAARPAIAATTTVRSLLTGRKFVITGLAILALALFGTTTVAAVNALTAPEPPPAAYDCSNAQGRVVDGTIIYTNCPAIPSR